eukprot:scaffold229099_cov32-Tisochrysis_lutea.AAC.3
MPFVRRQDVDLMSSQKEALEQRASCHPVERGQRHGELSAGTACAQCEGSPQRAALRPIQEGKQSLPEIPVADVPEVLFARFKSKSLPRGSNDDQTSKADTTCRGWRLKHRSRVEWAAKRRSECSN